jgi:hypothetical protein
MSNCSSQKPLLGNRIAVITHAGVWVMLTDTLVKIISSATFTGEKAMNTLKSFPRFSVANPIDFCHCLLSSLEIFSTIAIIIWIILMLPL